MKRFLAGLVVGIVALSPAVANAQQAIIMGGDGSYLGTVSDDRYSDESICNRYGPYGSPYEETSIFNQFGNYGGKFSDFGAYSTMADRPPALVVNGQVVMLISKNKRFKPSLRLDPDILRIHVCGESL